MSMSSTQKPRQPHQYQLRPQSAEPIPRYQHYQTGEKNLRMSIIDQLSPIKDLPASQSQKDLMKSQHPRGSFYQVRAKGQINPQLVSTRTQPSRLIESSSFSTTLNYTQESHLDTKVQTLPKQQVIISNHQILIDQLRFSQCQLDDMKRQFDRSVQLQFDQLIDVLKSAQSISIKLIDENLTLKQKSFSDETDKLKHILADLQQKATLLVSDNTKLQAQLKQIQDDNKRLAEIAEESVRKLKVQSQTPDFKENLPQASNCAVSPAVGTQKMSAYSTRELAYKLEQSEIKLLTLQISNDNLKKQLQHYQLDASTMASLRETVGILEQKTQDLLNQKDALTQENDLLRNKIFSLEMQAKDSRTHQEELSKREFECRQLGEELTQVRSYYEQCLKKNQNLEMRLLYYLEQEIKAHTAVK